MFSSETSETSAPTYILLPWLLFRDEISDSFGLGALASARARRELVRIAVDDEMKTMHQPGRKNVEKVAYSIMSKHPTSFQVYADSKYLSDGFLTDQLENRCDNEKRRYRSLQDGRRKQEVAPHGCTTKHLFSESMPEAEILKQKLWLQDQSRLSTPSKEEGLFIIKNTVRSFHVLKFFQIFCFFRSNTRPSKEIYDIFCDDYRLQLLLLLCA